MITMRTICFKYIPIDGAGRPSAAWPLYVGVNAMYVACICIMFTNRLMSLKCVLMLLIYVMMNCIMLDPCFLLCVLVPFLCEHSTATYLSINELPPLGISLVRVRTLPSKTELCKRTGKRDATADIVGTPS